MSLEGFQYILKEKVRVDNKQIGFDFRNGHPNIIIVHTKPKEKKNASQ